MKIKLKKEGGFMGLISNTDLELDKLPEDEQDVFSDIMTNMPEPKPKEEKEKEKVTRSMPMRDAFLYEIKVKKGARYVTMKYDDKSIPENVYKIFQKYISDIPSV